MENPLISQQISPGYKRTLGYTENLMVAVCEFTDGPSAAPDQPHSHPHEQITYVAEGELYFFKGDERIHLNRGDLVTIPSGIPHCIQKLSSRVILIDSFSPVRKDFINK